MCTKLLIVSKKMALAVGMCLMSVTSVLGQSVGEAALIAAEALVVLHWVIS